MKKGLLLFAIAIAINLTACASRPVPRAKLEDLPPLENGWSRIYVTAGMFDGMVRLWSDGQVGPVFINNERVGTTAKDEHFAVDLFPGNYEMYCITNEPDKKTYIEKRKFTFEAGEERYFACDIAPKGAGMYFGLVGALASEYLAKIYLEERPLDNQNSTLVAYKVINGKNISPESTSKELKKITQPSLGKTSMQDRLENMKELYEKKLITKEEYDKKRQELLDDL